MTKIIEFSYSPRQREYIQIVLFGLLLSIVMLSSGAYGKEQDAMSMRLGGCGGVYFYASAGELWVQIEKQDLNIRPKKNHLRALLFAPDRSVIDEAWIVDDGRVAKSGPGPVQRVLLRTNVERPGVYGLNITVIEDRYGENISWGFKSNCRKYLVETSRGHRDARHEEPIILRNVGHESDVGFMVGIKPFSIGCNPSSAMLLHSILIRLTLFQDTTYDYLS